MFHIDSKVMCIERSRRPEHVCENGRSRCQAVHEILIVEVTDCGTIAGDRGKFQASKTAMYFRLYIASNKQGAAIAVLIVWNFLLSPAMGQQSATSKFNISGTARHLDLPFSHRVQNAEIFRYT